MSEEVRRFLHETFGWPTESPVVTELDAGIQNKRFRATWGGDSLSLRRDGDPKHEGIHRRSELIAHRYAASVGVAPELLYTGGGWLVHRFVDGRRLTAVDLTEPTVLQTVVKSIRATHRGPVVPDEVCPFELIRRFAADAKRRRRGLPDRFLAGFNQTQEIEEWLKAHPQPRTLCHCDLGFSNIVRDGARIWFLDWECAAMSDPFRDLAKICNHGGLRRPGQLEHILAGYFRRLPSPQDLSRFRRTLRSEAYLTAIWNLAYEEAPEGGVGSEAHRWLTLFEDLPDDCTDD